MVIDSTFIPSPLPGNQGKCQSVTIGLVLLAISILMCFQKSPHSHITPRSLSTLRKFQEFEGLWTKTKHRWEIYFCHLNNQNLSIYIFFFNKSKFCREKDHRRHETVHKRGRRVNIRNRGSSRAGSFRLRRGACPAFKEIFEIRVQRVSWNFKELLQIPFLEFRNPSKL